MWWTLIWLGEDLQPIAQGVHRREDERNKEKQRETKFTGIVHIDYGTQAVLGIGHQKTVKGWGWGDHGVWVWDGLGWTFCDFFFLQGRHRLDLGRWHLSMMV
jgi:hypothetical protein